MVDRDRSRLSVLHAHTIRAPGSRFDCRPFACRRVQRIVRAAF
jgi:hypothetical protein